jgi:hypothetical protein
VQRGRAVSTPTGLGEDDALIYERHTVSKPKWSLGPKRAMMSRMPGPTIVWMVHLSRGDSPDGVRGTLSMEDDALVFSPATGGMPARFPLESVRRAKRLVGSPVLRLDWNDTGTASHTAFYFVEPPPLRPADSTSRSVQEPAPGPLGPLMPRRRSRHFQMRDNVKYLQTTGIGTKELISAWAAEIGERLS